MRVDGDHLIAVEGDAGPAVVGDQQSHAAVFVDVVHGDRGGVRVVVLQCAHLGVVEVGITRAQLVEVGGAVAPGPQILGAIAGQGMV
ncbi:hypothetical protein ACFWAY_47425 [Rhodococcus sp. NPDC059968]|uniref:hypothetical protein n=1 Tax=Rhodococcus sp. NPDC059968 TaxID=3347017 RepID=UPI003671F08F